MAASSGKNLMRNAMDEGPRRARRRFQLIGEVIAELSKVTWPTRQETIRLTGLVAAIAWAMGALLGLWDFGFGQLANRFLL